MKINKLISALFLVSIFLFSCDPAKKTVATSTKPVPSSVPSVPAGDDGIIEVTILQMNDVYEISPAPSDGRGGLARVATIRKELLAKNPNTITVLAGEFISPSVLGTLKNDGKRIRGKHMVEVLNTLGLDWVVFGNHEFDYDDLSDLQARLDESKFTWLAGNVRLKPPVVTPGTTTFTQQFFKNKPGGGSDICPDNQVVVLKDNDGTTLNLGLFGVLISSGRKPWAEYSDWMESARKSYSALQGKSDVVLALTHLDIADDKKLAAMLPKISLIMGGHEHENQLHKVGTTVITKADANAKTVYIHTLRYDKKKGSCTVKSELRKVDTSIPDEPMTAAVVAKWEKIKNDALIAAGINPNNVVTKLEKPLDCREGFIRTQQAPIGAMITEAMYVATKAKPDCAILNSGSIRIDDVLSGNLTELDIVRILPFGGAIVTVEISGALLRKTLDAGYTNKGNGGYLQLYRVRRDEASAKWFISDKELDNNKLYQVTMPEFLLSGNESNMAFLKASIGADGKSTNLDILKITKADPTDKSDLRNDIRLVFIRYLKGE
ncbi:MAG: bifunctional metallophosphatase/5'-nucleotidase [Saprospiraceae bacterium]|nr:bifunctional metallophosphatase/5'-nucleotidase [Saprospiraceae bacterium]